MDLTILSLVPRPQVASHLYAARCLSSFRHSGDSGDIVWWLPIYEPPSRICTVNAGLTPRAVGTPRCPVRAGINAQRANRCVSIARFACLGDAGDLDAAREQLDQAEALFRDMGMTWWLEQAVGLRGRIDSGKEFKWFAPYVDGPPAV